MMEAAMHRIVLDITQRVVHPAHVPLEVEPEPAEVRRLRDAWKRRRFLGERHHARVVPTDRNVELAQELDRVEVLAAAVPVRHPFTGLAAVVEVQHRRDRIHAQAVDVIPVDPVQRVRHEEVAHLVPAVIEDLGAPVRMLAEPRVGVLVEARAVEVRETVFIARKMRRHPVDDHAQARLVTAVDEGHEILRRAEARTRRVVADHLVAPRAVKRVFGYAHEFEVRVALVLRVRNQLVRYLTPVEELRLAAVIAAPAAGMHFVDVDRLQVMRRRLARVDPVCIVPLVAFERGDDRSRARTQLHRKAVRIGLEDGGAGPGADLVLVERARPDARHEQLPDPGTAAGLQRVLAAVPQVERTDHADAFCVGRPDGEPRAGQAVEFGRMRAELVVDRVVIAFAEQVQVEVGELRREVVRVVLVQLDAARIAHVQLVRLQRTAVRHAALEQPRRMDRFQFDCGLAFPAHADGHRVRLEHAHDAHRSVVPACKLVVTQHRTRRGVQRVDQRVDVGGRKCRADGHPDESSLREGVRGWGIRVSRNRSGDEFDFIGAAVRASR